MAESVSAASYGTVLVLASLMLVDAAAVKSGIGWELVTGVGVTTWLAHLYAEAVGEHVRHGVRVSGEELMVAGRDGAPILLATVLPAVVLLLGRLGVLDARVALWAAAAVAGLQLLGVGVLVGSALSPGDGTRWWYVVVTAGVGLAVVGVKVVLGH
jgi:hypothetical protein